MTVTLESGIAVRLGEFGTLRNGLAAIGGRLVQPAPLGRTFFVPEDLFRIDTEIIGHWEGGAPAPPIGA
jgi:hypothetical protein